MSPAEQAAQIVDYQLSHKRAAQPRRFKPMVISSELIDDAYNPGGLSEGQWYDSPLPPQFEDTVENWVAWYFQMALQEEIHETLEWFRVHGKLYIDPHIVENKIVINQVVRDL